MKSSMPAIFGGSFLMMFIRSLAIAILSKKINITSCMSGVKLRILTRRLF